MTWPMMLPLLTGSEACLFTATMALASRPGTRIAGEYVGTAFHLLLLPIVAAVPLGTVGQGAGVAWIACDLVAGVGILWTADRTGDVGPVVFNAVRMAGHLLAAIWIALVSETLDLSGLVVGSLLVASFFVHTLMAGRLPEKALAVPGVLMLAWLVLLARHFHLVAP